MRVWRAGRCLLHASVARGLSVPTCACTSVRPQNIYFFLWAGTREGTGATGEGFALTGFMLACALLITEIYLVGRYLLNTISMNAADQGARRRLSQLPSSRLRERMRFIGKRFATHAPYWQFVVVRAPCRRGSKRESAPPPHDV